MREAPGVVQGGGGAAAEDEDIGGAGHAGSFDRHAAGCLDPVGARVDTPAMWISMCTVDPVASARAGADMT
jgi:hypothetical protein